MKAPQLVKDEPVTIAAGARAIILCAVAFGLSWTADQIAAVMLVVEVVVTPIVRHLVKPTSKLE